MIAATVAWDNRLSTTYEQAIAAVEATMWQVATILETTFPISSKLFNLNGGQITV